MTSNPSLDAQLTAMSAAADELNTQMDAVNLALTSADPGDPEQLLRIQMEMSTWTTVGTATTNELDAIHDTLQGLVNNI